MNQVREKYMKNKIKSIVVAILAVLVMAGVFMFVNIGGAEISKGIYELVGYEEYPDAYIVVEDDTIQFFNIDLNAIYQQGQLDNYNKMIEKGFQSDFTNEQVKEYSDLNAMFVTNPYTIDYEQSNDNKTGTFTYIYYCIRENSAFGFVLEYNSFDKTIQINSPIQNLLFER